MRRLLLLAALALGACATGSSAGPAAYVLQAGHIDLQSGPDGNTEIFDAPEGLVVVDTGRHPGHSQAILDHARQVGKPVIAVVNTHWHLDHTTGNHDIFAAYPAARLVATGAMAGAINGFLAKSIAANREQRGNADLPPDRKARIERFLTALDDRRAMIPADPVTHDETAMLGGRAFELHVAHAAASEDDLWLTVPDEHVAVVGDLVVAPVPFFDTGCEEGWKAALDRIEGAQWTTLIPGHGAPMTRSDFRRWRSAFDAWLDCAASDRAASACADDWMRDATGFYTLAEAPSVRELAEGYVAEIIRKPEARMDYCSAGD